MKKLGVIQLAQEYKATHRLRDIIDDNTLLLSALSRFEIPLGFGDMTVKVVCRKNNVDVNTFLAFANLTSDKLFSISNIDLSSLIKYLQNAHTYFLDFLLPNIKRQLIDAISSAENNDIPLLILKFYDDYQEEVRKHMSYENDHVFAYVSQLQKGNNTNDYKIADFMAKHKPIASKLRELKEIIICHYMGDGNRINEINSVLFNIITCERDLLKHCEVEDKIFVPAVIELEKQVASGSFADTDSAECTNNPAVNDLTQREREIISCVARGLSNKEIADRLCLSVHTVTTHRRNVCSKLGIHSTSGLTIFAIIHHLIDLSEVKLYNS